MEAIKICLVSAEQSSLMIAGAVLSAFSLKLGLDPQFTVLSDFPVITWIFLPSVCAVSLLLTGLPSRRAFFLFTTRVLIQVALLSLAFTYVSLVRARGPEYLANKVELGMKIWAAVMIPLLVACHSMQWLPNTSFTIKK
ncbi:hypothetical protein ACJRO7_026350 [Eucalyptus globulus]|uniref:WAT1-related protein n=1 Tax=Eucalyptus globulus TaxID=34317 RepID=A0ABD3JSM3_EUCGL